MENENASKWIAQKKDIHACNMANSVLLESAIACDIPLQVFSYLHLSIKASILCAGTFCDFPIQVL